MRVRTRARTHTGESARTRAYAAHVRVASPRTIGPAARPHQYGPHQYGTQGVLARAERLVGERAAAVPYLTRRS